MTKKLKHLLVDTVVVIDAHEKGYWERLCNAYRVFLPGTVIEDELFFFTILLECRLGSREEPPTAPTPSGS